MAKKMNKDEIRDLLLENFTQEELPGFFRFVLEKFLDDKKEQ